MVSFKRYIPLIHGMDKKKKDKPMLSTGAIIAIVSAYLLGSLPFAYLITRRIRGEDIREVGTRNMGAMNTIYRVGFGWGLLVLLLDMAKGALAILVARWLDTPENIQLAAAGVPIAGRDGSVHRAGQIICHTGTDCSASPRT